MCSRRNQYVLDWNKKLEKGDEMAQSDMIKAQIQTNDVQRKLQDTELAELKGPAVGGRVAVPQLLPRLHAGR